MQIKFSRTGSLWIAFMLVAGSAWAQVAPPDDTPSTKLGATIFTDFTYQSEPETVDADGNRINPSAFNVGRAYINFTGRLNHLIGFRITPDIARESGSGSSLKGSYDFRLKYAYAQLNLDDWLTRGSYIRAGATQTPYVDFIEGVYRYRFQGTVFVDREGFLTSSDLGIAGRYNFPGDYGEIVAGYYNGEGYNHVETSNQKALQARVTFRPFPAAGSLKGLRFTAFADEDHYFRDAPKRRLAGAVTYESKWANAGFEYLDASDAQSATTAEIDSQGYSIWATPKFGRGWEGLFRHDQIETDGTDAKKDRDILGVAYWLPKMEKVTSAVLLDYERVTWKDFTPSKPDEKRIAVHLLINF